MFDGIFLARLLRPVARGYCGHAIAVDEKIAQAIKAVESLEKIMMSWRGAC